MALLEKQTAVRLDNSIQHWKPTISQLVDQRTSLLKVRFSGSSRMRSCHSMLKLSFGKWTDCRLFAAYGEYTEAINSVVINKE